MNSKVRSIMMMYAMAGAMSEQTYGEQIRFETRLTDSEIEEIKRVREIRREEIKIKKGMKLFNIEGIELYALNYKNAVRKAAKLRAKVESACL